MLWQKKQRKGELNLPLQALKTDGAMSQEMWWSLEGENDIWLKVSQKTGSSVLQPEEIEFGQ